MLQENIPEFLASWLSSYLSFHEFYPPNPSFQSYMYNMCGDQQHIVRVNIPYSDTAEK